MELIHLMARYNCDLQNWVASHPANVSWMSPEIQNEILHLIAVEVVHSIVNECSGCVYSILCDEVSDRSNNELLIRFKVGFSY
jgi:hypothetical protein